MGDCSKTEVMGNLVFRYGLTVECVVPSYAEDDSISRFESRILDYKGLGESDIYLAYLLRGREDDAFAVGFRREFFDLGVELMVWGSQGWDDACILEEGAEGEELSSEVLRGSGVLEKHRDELGLLVSGFLAILVEFDVFHTEDGEETCNYAESRCLLAEMRGLADYADWNRDGEAGFRSRGCGVFSTRKGTTLDPVCLLWEASTGSSWVCVLSSLRPAYLSLAGSWFAVVRPSFSHWDGV